MNAEKPAPLRERVRVIALAIAVALALGVLVAMKMPAPFLDHLWASYLYEGPGDDKWIPVPFTGQVAADDSMWTIDTPEDPDSILALLTYADWNARYPLNFRATTHLVIRVSGNLHLHGAHVTFWALGAGNRWHLTTPIPMDGQTHRIDLGGEWHHSWSSKPASLEESLRSVDSYGLAFVGFSEEVTGRIVLEELRFD